MLQSRISKKNLTIRRLLSTYMVSNLVPNVVSAINTGNTASVVDWTDITVVLKLVKQL